MSRVSVRAAGVVAHRVRGGQLQVLLVHRPKYDDWSWPKGKLEPGEDWVAAAARETLEETGLRVRLGVPLPESRYTVRGGAQKRVRYWAGQVVGGTGDLEHEIDEVAWLGVRAAARRISYRRDRDQLDALVRHHAGGRLDTWPLLVVRHAHAVPRGDWSGRDPARPLSPAGRRRAAWMTRILEAYAPGTVWSSPSVRCVDTVQPYVDASGARLLTKKGLSEEGHDARPRAVDKHLRRMMEAAEPVAVCTHGALCGPVLRVLRRRAGGALERGDRRMLSRLATVPLDKGEILACTIVRAGDDARVVAVERHRPAA